MQETQVLSLGWEDPLEKGMAAHSSILAWRIPGTEEPDGLQSLGHKESDTTAWLTHMRSALLKTSRKSLGGEFVTTVVELGLLM